jgi:hypothetical protein
MKQMQTLEQSKESSTEKWFDDPALADIFLFFLPPLGIYCLLKSRKIVSSPVKIATGIMTFTGLIILIVALV